MLWTNNIIYCLGLTPRDRVIIITDVATRDIADAISREIGGKCEAVQSIVIEDYTKRPAAEVPARMREDIVAFHPTVSVYAAQAQEGELSGFRGPLRENILMQELGCRHAHMVGVTSAMTQQGLAVDYRIVGKLTRALFERCRAAKVIRVKNAEGTDLTATFSSSRRWVAEVGRFLKPRAWGNLPAGETFTSPQSASGTFAARVLGDYLSERYGVLGEPLLLEVRDGYFTRIVRGDPQQARDVEQYLAASPNNNRVGEFAIGTNLGITKLIGKLLQDEKYPGVHIAFGHPYPHETGADWDAEGHLDLIAVDTDVWIDDTQVMRNGKFLIP